MGPNSGKLRPLGRSVLTSEPESHSPPSSKGLRKLPHLPSDAGKLRVLDFDCETVAAGFADPAWVPQKITCVAWSWIGSNQVESLICRPEGLFGKPVLRKAMLDALLEQIAEADILTGHNIERFDLPAINAEAMRLGLDPIREVVVHDTMRVYRSKGFKKGQDNLGRLLRVPAEKQTMDWQHWQDAYDQDGWGEIRSRAESDVVMHKQIRQEMIDRGILKPPRKWRGR
jgi:hypothetical protein